MTIDPATGKLRIEYAQDAFGSAVLTVRATDGAGASVDTAVRITVNPVDDAPVVSAGIGSVAYEGEALAIASESDVTVSDVDSTTLNGATLQIRDYVVGEVVLSVVPSDGISSKWDAATGTLSLSGTASLASYQQVLRSIVYGKTGAAPASGVQQILITVTDGEVNSDPAVVEVRFPAPTETQLPPATPPPPSTPPTDLPPPTEVETTPSEPEAGETNEPTPPPTSSSIASGPGAGSSAGDAAPAQAANAAPQPPAQPAPQPPTQQPEPPPQPVVAAPPLQTIPLAAPVAVPAPPPPPAAQSLAGSAAVLNFIASGGQLDKDLSGFQASVKQHVVAEQHFERVTAETVGVVSGGLAVGYVLWLIRGGYLLSSLLTSMPAWRLIDPLPILDYLDDESRADKSREDEDESLEELLKKNRRSRVKT
jgi:hypothetical protein